jgi:hypothetical protein
LGAGCVAATGWVRVTGCPGAAGVVVEREGDGVADVVGREEAGALFAGDVVTAFSIAPPPVLGCPEGWGSAGTRGAVAEILRAAGAVPPLSAWATPPLASRPARGRATAARLGDDERTE